MASNEGVNPKCIYIFIIMHVWQIDDKEAGKIIVKGLHNYNIGAVTNQILYLIDFETRDGRFKYRIVITGANTGNAQTETLNHIILTDTPLSPNGKPYTGMMLSSANKQKAKYIEEIVSIKDSIILTLLELKEKKKEEW